MSRIAGVAIYLITPMISAISQIMLKKSAVSEKYRGARFYLNPLVISAYALFFMCMLMNILALKSLELSTAGVLEASGYIYVMILGRRYLGERITRRKLIGNAVIIIGIALTLILQEA